MTVQLESQAIPNGVLLMATGQIILGSCDYFEKDFTRLGFQGEHEVVEFDLSQISHIDSAGMGSLMRLHQQAGNYGKIIKVTAMSAKVKSLFELTRLSKFLNIEVKEAK